MSKELIVCHGKQRFANANEARQVARAMSRRKDTSPSAYKCSFCNGWHVGLAFTKQR